MSFKTIILVIFLSFLVGLAYVLFSPGHKIDYVQQIAISNPLTRSKNIIPTPTPKPTPIPISKDANLEEEVNKLTPEDYSKDFKELKDSI